MNNIFLTEMGFNGQIAPTHPNMRTEFAWMYALQSDHMNIFDYNKVKDYDNVFIIFPKGKVFLCADGSRIIKGANPFSELLQRNIVDVLKNNNKRVHYVQEGPVWWFNDYEINDQFNFIELLAKVDIIFTHNIIDTQFYKGWFPNKQVEVIPTLMFEHNIQDIEIKTENKTIIGGNFSRWYGGLQSYKVAREFENNIWTMSSHSQRDLEDKVGGLNHFPRLDWNTWMRELSKFKYAVHLMPTVAAGTFSLNCAYFGIPCIGNEKVDTQTICHPMLSVDVDDVEKAVFLAEKLYTDKEFYEQCNKSSKSFYNKYFSVEVWKEKMNKRLSEEA